jgi:hypothetical protein
MSNLDPANDPLSFAKKMWGGMGFSLPNMVTPTLNVEEIEKKVRDLKAVESWLKMNLSMLQMTIQGLEMQCVTLNAVRAMGQMAGNYGTGGVAPADSQSVMPVLGSGNEALKQAALWPLTLLQQMQEQMQKAAATAAAAQADPPEDAKP